MNPKSFCLGIWLFVVMFLITACGDADLNTPLMEGGDAPGQVTNISVENTAGGANISYDPPADPNLQYVMAEVITKNNKRYEYKSSPYNAIIKVVGLGSVDPQEVRIYSVSKSEKKSDPVNVTIYPLDPPFIAVRESLVATADFGGINIQYINESEAELAFTLALIGENNEMEEYGTTYTKAKNGNYSWRGLNAEEMKFAIYIRDRWDNFSDTLYTTLTPLYEEKLDKKKYRDLTLPGDAQIYTTEPNINKIYLWDELFSVDFSDPWTSCHWLNCTTELPNNLEPKTITIDLGQTAQLSRVRINHYYAYDDRAPRRYEIWGCPDTPPADGSWDAWIQMASYEQIKPSGLPAGSYGPGDAEAWVAGDNITFGRDLPPIRYIRIKCLENWRGDSHLSLAETTFFGSVVE